MTTGEWIQLTTRRLQSVSIETARLDSLILLEDCLQVDRALILGHPETELSPERQDTLGKLVARREGHEPLAYIRGYAEFYGRQFGVNNHVLVPRPETEMIIEKLLALELAIGCVLIDVGTGSGAIAVTAKLELPTHRVLAFDIDHECLRIARSNADKHSADVECLLGDLLEPLHGIDHVFDSSIDMHNYVLLCNLPYVPDDYEINHAARHEPSLALFSGSDGLDHYRKLFHQLDISASKPEYILTESLPEQHEELRTISRDSGYREHASAFNSADFVQVFKSGA